MFQVDHKLEPEWSRNASHFNSYSATREVHLQQVCQASPSAAVDNRRVDRRRETLIRGVFAKSKRLRWSATSVERMVRGVTKLLDPGMVVARAARTRCTTRRRGSYRSKNISTTYSMTTFDLSHERIAQVLLWYPGATLRRYIGLSIF